MSRRVAALVIGVTAALLLGGCAQPAARVIPTAPATVTPVFATDADALAAAEKAYAAYLAVSDEVAHDAGNGVDRLSSVDTAAQLARDTKSFTQMSAEGHHTTGPETFSLMTLQKLTMSASNKALVDVYVCLDISRTVLLDRSNRDVGSTRRNLLPLQVEFQSDAPRSKNLLVEESDFWSGRDFCS